MNIRTIATRSVGLLFAVAWIGITTTTTTTTTAAAAPLPALSHDDSGRLLANALRGDIPVSISPGREADLRRQIVNYRRF